ncbi:MAG: hypothetical protein XU15_C0011G0053 [candidate division NC10 bacterium CSP1-5]|nr:MAG: hypothetical protein XU15_C0011G0053 [candidate division NC10 bacterium CSP1-5]
MAEGALVPTGGRGCGNRKVGSIYAECGLSPFGSPIESFLYCPPVRVPADFIVKAQGITLLEDPTDPRLFHIVDHLGVNSWPNVADWFEEARRFGLSHNISGSGVEYAKLTPGSRIMPIHPHAWVHNFPVFAAAWIPGLKPGDRHAYDFCPKEITEHNILFDGPRPEMCAGVWYQSLLKGQFPVYEDEMIEHWKAEVPTMLETAKRLVIRTMPSFEYQGFCPPDGVTPQFEAAFIGSWPITRLVVINDPVDGKHEKALKRASESSLPVEEVNE